MKKVELRKPFDAHIHFRKSAMLQAVLPNIARYCRYAVAMGNLEEPIVQDWQVVSYQQEIMDAATNANCRNFEPIMTVMLTYSMTPEILEESFSAGAHVLKLIPAGTSTGANNGVALWDLPAYYPVLAEARDLGMIFSVHCELNVEPQTDKEIPLYEQEARGISFVDRVIKDFPGLKIIFEHVSSKELCQYFLSLDSYNVATTITGHHPFIFYHQVCDKFGLIKNPWLYCKPVAKFKEDVEMVRRLMLSGHPRVFFGSDFAPHTPLNKVNCAAGIANIPEVYIPMLWELFLNKFNETTARIRFEDFTAYNALDFYGLPSYGDTIVLENKKWRAPAQIGDGIKIFKGNQKLNWKIEKY